MISHEYRCIFIHVQRCAGTSIEKWIAGANWGKIQPETKHLLASQARKIYSNVWDRYYKFAFVRHPVDRMISCLKFGGYFGLSYNEKKGFSFSGYHKKFGDDVVVEHDHRYWRRDDLVTHRHVPGTVYRNILDEQLDFIGRVENLDADLKIVARALGKSGLFNLHAEKSAWPVARTQCLSDADIMHIEAMYRDDMHQFSYASKRTMVV
jgi:hypothetical protein